MLTVMLDGIARTAGELAHAANASPQAASNHLTQLLAGGLVTVSAQGRHRYYSLSGHEVAHVLEALELFRGGPVREAPTAGPPAELRLARSCYDHLAGELGVAITARLVELGWLEVGQGEGFVVTSEGEACFGDLGVDVIALRQGRRALTRSCMDWTERRPHLAGALGASLLARWLDLGWLARGKGRALRLTLTGRLAFEREIGLRLRAGSGAEPR